MIKKILLLSGAIIFSVLPLQISMATPAVPLPNVLLIIADDLGLGDLRSFSPAAQTSTPHIDALAAQGMRFSRFYTDSTCSASRASLLTGQSSARLGFHPVARGISPEVVTLPEWLKRTGYSTHLVGKWHVGELNAGAMPSAQGFDTWMGYLNQWFLQGPDANGKPVIRAPIYNNPWLQNEKGEWRQYTGYLPDILTQYAVNEIATLSKKNQPWLMWYATPLVHGPLHQPPEMHESAPASDDEKYHAMVRHLDQNIGELVSALEKSGQRSNTLIIFLSDNGAPEKRIGSNADFEGGKAHYSEGAVRAPMFWVDTSRVMPQSLDERAITIADIFPTLAARLGQPLPFKTDGVDFNAFSEIKAINKRPLFWMSRSDASVVSSDKQWRFTESWVFREIQASHLWRIGNHSAEDKSTRRHWYWSVINPMKQQFIAWLDSVSETAVSQEKVSSDVSKITGNNFLRTPLKEWDFYVAVQPHKPIQTNSHTQAEQVIAEQQGVWSLRYNTEKKQILVDMYGHHWVVPLNLPDRCTLIGLNADVYDRYTNISKSIHPTQLLLSIDGQEVARTKWTIESLADVKTALPTWLGQSSEQTNLWRGQLSEARFYHRANRVGEWPYFLDEKKLKEDLCAQLQ